MHIHAKVHIGNAEVLTTQLYFDDDLSDEVFASDPYAEHEGRRTTNAEDGIYADGPSSRSRPRATGTSASSP